MKKAILIVATVLMAMVVVAQQQPVGQNRHVPITVATHSSPFNSYVTAGSWIACLADSGVLYITKTHDWGSDATLAAVLASHANYVSYSLTTWSGKTTPYFVDTANAQNVYGVKTFYGNDVFNGNNSFTGTNSMTKKLTIHEAAGTTDLFAAFNDKTTAGDSGMVINKLGYLGIGKATASVPLDVVGAATITGAVTLGNTITGGALSRGNASFTTSATRVAVYVLGAAATDYVQVTPIAPTGSSRPVAGDVMSVIIVTDSIIVQRQAGTTSGGTFDWLRIK